MNSSHFPSRKRTAGKNKRAFVDFASRDPSRVYSRVSFPWSHDNKSKMEAISRVIRIQLPNYLRSLPIPSTFGGFLKLSGSEWVQLVPIVVTTSVVVYLVISALIPSKPKKDEDWVNKTHQKEKEKVADAFQIEDLGDKTVCCRCWKSKKVCVDTSSILPFHCNLDNK